MKYSKTINIVCLLTIALGFLVAIGWMADLQIFKTVLPGYVSMKFNTAICLVLAGFALFFMVDNRLPLLANIFSVLFITICSVTLFQQITGQTLGIDNLLIKDGFFDPFKNPYPGRMAPPTAICLVLLGLSFLLIKKVSTRVIGQYLLHVITLTAFLAITGYVLQVPTLYKLSLFASMAIHTSIALFCISIAASLINPEIGITGLFTGKQIGNRMARSLFPKMVIALFILAFLRIEAHRFKLVDVEFGIALFAMSFTIVGLFLIQNSAKSLNAADEKRAAAENKLLFTNQNLEKIVRQRTEELQIAVGKLKETSERHKIFIQQSANAIAMLDNDMRYLAASKKWIEEYGLSGREIIGLSHYDVFPEIGDEWKAIHQACLKGAINQCDEAPFERLDGSVQWITWDVRPWYIAENEIGGILMYTSDITKLKKIDKEKHLIEEILDKTNEVARIGTWEFDLTTNSIYWSRITREIHEVQPNYKPELDSALNFFRPGKSRELIQNAVGKAIEDGTPYDLELELVTGKGNIVWARAIGQAEFKNGACKRLYGVFQDINEVKQARDSLFVVNKELQTILNSAHVSIIGTDVNGMITHFSRGAELLLQYSASEMIGIQTPALVHLEEEVIKRGNELTELYGKPINGFDVFVELPKKGQFESREWTYVRKDGSTFPVQLVVTAVKDESGSIAGFLGIATDISDLEKAKSELEVLTATLQKKNKQLLNFAHITSHNLRSPVSNLNTVLFLYKDTTDDEEKSTLWGHMETVVNHLTDTLNQLVDSLRIQEDKGREREWLKFSDVLTKTKEIFIGTIIETDANIISDFSEVDDIEYPRSYMESIMLNLLSNALKYKSPNRIPEIHFKTTMTEQGTVLKVGDNGLGIDMKKHGDKLFGLNKTFHRHAEAKGVGLFMTKTQIEAMGGSIKADSEVDKGATFTIYFNQNI